MKIKWWYVRHPGCFIYELKRRWHTVAAIEERPDLCEHIAAVYYAESPRKRHWSSCGVCQSPASCPTPCDCDEFERKNPEMRIKNE